MHEPVDAMRESLEAVLRAIALRNTGLPDNVAQGDTRVKLPDNAAQGDTRVTLPGSVAQGDARLTIAVSGGVDSLTLAAVAAQIHGTAGTLADVSMVHAVSPAVPSEATSRVRRLAAERGWQLTILGAGEFDDPSYRANPVNRCFYCKTNLYAAIRERTAGQILSGANVDDLGEYRPGLDAARLQGVRHPFIEAGMRKSAVRALARQLGLMEIAELPASPCLSSRVETGIRIEPATLAFIHDVEGLVAAQTAAATVRCRVRATAVVVELDSTALARLGDRERRHLSTLIAARPHRPADLPVAFAAYVNGSAFVGARS